MYKGKIFSNIFCKNLAFYAFYGLDTELEPEP